MEKAIVIKFMKWLKLECTLRTTSRNNIYSSYWQLRTTGLLYTDEELLEYWIKEYNG